MNPSATPPVPLINPTLLEKWNQLPAAQPLGMDLTRQDWDIILAALLDINGSVSSLAKAVVSAGIQDWSAYGEYAERNNNAQVRIVRFIETVMYKATMNG